MRCSRPRAVLVVCLLATGVAVSYHADWLPRYLLGSGADESPALECPTLVELGPVEHGAVIAAEFVVKNRGGGQLVLNGFRSNCACESVEVKRADGFVRATEVRLGPNEVAEMRLVLSVNGRTHESLRAPVYFLTNVPEIPETVILVVASRILAGVTAVPSSITFGAVQIGTPIRHTVELFDARGNPRKVLRVQSGNPGRVAARLIPVTEDAGRPDEGDRGTLVGTVEVMVNTTSTGSITSDVLVYLDDGATTPEIIRVAGRVVAPVEVSPSSLALPRSSSSGPIYSGVCLVRSTSGGEFDLTVAAAPKGVNVSVGAADPASPGARAVTVELTQDFLRTYGESGSFSVRMCAVVASKRQDLGIPIRVHRPANGDQP